MPEEGVVTLPEEDGVAQPKGVIPPLECDVPSPGGDTASPDGVTGPPESNVASLDGVIVPPECDGGSPGGDTAPPESDFASYEGENALPGSDTAW